MFLTGNVCHHLRLESNHVRSYRGVCQFFTQIEMQLDTLETLLLLHVRLQD